jgi:hypothetical protein
MSPGYVEGCADAQWWRVLGGVQKVVHGTFDGVYFQEPREPNLEPVKVADVAQVGVLGRLWAVDCAIRCALGFLFLIIGL